MSDFLKLKKSNCKNCYKCIRHCPVKSIKFSGNQAHIVNDECILCGQCFVVCPQNAKQVSDSTEAVKVLLQSGAPVIASVAPSFVANYDGCGIESIREAIKKLGFSGAEETAVGAKIVKTEYENFLKNNDYGVLISSCCPSVNLLIQKHFPAALPFLAKVVTPMQAHALDIKKRIPGAKVVFIGPCVAKKDEAERYKTVDAVLTFEELSKMFKENSIEPEQYADSEENSRTRLFPTAGGIINSMKKENSKQVYMTVDGVENCISALKDVISGNINNCFIEMSVCSGSCVGGPVMEKYHRSPVRDFAVVTRYAGKLDYSTPQPDYSEINVEYSPIYNKTQNYSESEISSVLRQMGKNKTEDELNCGSCGYDTCREKAIAILDGKADISMCLPFLKDKAESFSDNIINNTPNGIIVVNEEFEVQQINKAALKIINMPRAADVLGEQVVRILDPKAFLEVKRTGRNLKSKRIYLAEYDRFVEQTIIFEREYKILICMLRDVTEEEQQKQIKERISRSTIETADNVVDKQMRIVQEIASLLGETAAETKIALTKLKESLKDE